MKYAKSEKKIQLDIKIKNKVLEAAEVLFKEKDYEDISVKEICQLSGVSVGTFYRRIGSKERLLVMFYQKISSESIILLLEKTHNKSPLEKINIITDLYLSYVVAFNYKFVKYFASLAFKSPLFAAPPGAISTFLKDYINEATEMKTFDSKYNPDYIFRAIYSSLRGAAFNWCLNGGKDDLKSDYSLTLDALLNTFIAK